MAFEEDKQNLGESEAPTKDSAIKSGIDHLNRAKEKSEKLNDGAEKFIKIIKTIITHKGIFIALAVIIFIILFIINAGAALHFLNLETRRNTMNARDIAFGSVVLERRNSK